MRCLPIALLALSTLATAIVGGCRSAPTGSSPEAPPSLPVWQTIGQSRQNRPIEARTIQAHTIRGGRTRIYLIGGIHGDEPEGLAMVDRLAHSWSAAPVADRVTLRLLRDMNPDGVAMRSRYNSAGVDLNRNWPATNFLARRRHGGAPLSEPETAAAYADLLRFDPDIVIVFHSAGSGPFVNFDGPARELAEAFAAAASDASGSAGGPAWRTVAHMGYPTAGSLGSFIGIDRGLPILTIEFQRGQDAESAYAAALAGLCSVGDAAPASPR